MEPKDILNLIEKLQRKTITDEELDQVQRIFRHTKDTKQLIKLMQQSYEMQIKNKDKLGDYENQQQIKHRLIQSTLPASPRTLKTRSTYYWGAAIAALFLLVSVFYFKSDSPSANKLELITVSTKPGERKKITLSDGTAILLNGNSSLSYPKLANTGFRMVKLDGEAFFDVASDKAKPFIVIANQFSTQVVGTSFNIDTDNNNTVQVNTGKVHVFDIADSDIMLALQSAGATSDNLIEKVNGLSTGKIALKQGEKASLNDSGTWDISPYYLKNWKDNELTYIDESLEKVIHNLYRNFGDSIVLDPSFMSQKITITLRDKSSIQILNTLAELCNGNLILNKEKNIWQITKN